MNTPKTIKVFLAEGDPMGIKIIELAGWVGKCFVIPRNSLKESFKRTELSAPAVYFLIGKSENGEDMVYVGESENFLERISDHQRKKDFWNTVICFVSANDFLHKGNIKYLESILADELKNAGRVNVESGKTSNRSKLSESEESDILAFAEILKLLLLSIGFTFLKKVVEEESDEEKYYCSGKGVVAEGTPTSEGFVVLKGSVISAKESEAISGSGVSVGRYQIINSDRVKKLDNGDYKLLDDEIFSSPSYAAGFVLGNSVNGWISWKNKDKKTLDEIKRKNL